MRRCNTVNAKLRRKDWKRPMYRRAMIRKLRAAWERGYDQRTKYGLVGKNNPFELKCFSAMHDRVKVGQAQSIRWKRTRAHFIEFLAAIGPIPKGMKRPTVGRKDHFRGYSRNNIQWQEFNVNASIKRSNQKCKSS